MMFVISKEPYENIKKALASFIIKKEQTTDKNDFGENIGDIPLQEKGKIENNLLVETTNEFYAMPKSCDWFTNWSYFLSLLYLIIVTFCYTIKNDSSTFDNFMVRFHYTF